eukprot:gene12942-14274_t
MAATSTSSRKSDGKFEDVSDEVASIEEGEEPGAAKLDSTMFAADSYEDLSNELVVKNIDGECSSRILSTSESFDDCESDLQHAVDTPYAEVKPASVDESFEVTAEIAVADRINSEEDINEVRKQRAGTLKSADRDSISEDVNDPEWARHKKHVFILSEAGKPIYSRYGNEEKLVTMMGVMQALVSFVQDNDDNIRVIIAGKHKFMFLVRGPLILVAVCSANDSPAQLLVQLTYVYHQVLSVLTFSQLSRVFEQRRNYDLRKLLSGTEKFIDNLLNLISSDPSFLLGAVRCLSLSSTVRDVIGQTLMQARAKDLVFAILVADNQLVTMVRPKKFILHPSDLHLIFNLVSASTSFRSAESWTPICLPRFDNSGYLHAYVSYFEDSCPACLLLLSTDRNSFFELAQCKAKIKERLDRYRCLESVTRANTKGSYMINQTGIPDLWHFIYKSRSTAQFTSPQVGPPYTTQEQRDRLFGQYIYLHHRIHSSLRPLKMLCYVGEREMLIGWVTSGFELYTAFSPMTSKLTAMNAVNKLLRWIKVGKAKKNLADSPKLNDLHRELAKLDKLSMKLKHQEPKGGDEELATSIKTMYLDILKRYGLPTDFANANDEYRNEIKVKFSDKVEKLWQTALFSGNFKDEELDDLEQEFKHHEKKLEEYRELASKIIEHDAISENDIQSLDKLPEKELKNLRKELKLKHHHINAAYLDLDKKVKERSAEVTNTFTDKRVDELWQQAQKSGFNKKELESIKEELKHFQIRIDKHNYWKEKHSKMSKDVNEGNLVDVEKQEEVSNKVQEHARLVKKYHATMMDRIRDKEEL